MLDLVHGNRFDDYFYGGGDGVAFSHLKFKQLKKNVLTSISD